LSYLKEFIQLLLGVGSPFGKTWSVGIFRLDHFGGLEPNVSGKRFGIFLGHSGKFSL